MRISLFILKHNPMPPVTNVFPREENENTLTPSPRLTKYRYNEETLAVSCKTGTEIVDLKA